MSRQPFNTRWAQSVEGESSSTVFQDPGSRMPIGWEGGADKDAPPAGQQNWWQNRVDSAMQDLERYGVMTWIGTAVYAAGAPVKSTTDGNYYESLVNANTGNNPVSTNGFWRLIGQSLYGVMPVGGVMAVAHTGVPDIGWLKCNGSVLLVSTYPRLYAKIGGAYNIGGEASTQFRLPDFRALFLRGIDDGRGIDPGRVFGQSQAGQIEAHTHSPLVSTGNGPLPAVFNNVVTNRYGSNVSYVVGSEAGLYNSNTGGNETRPVNSTVTYWIKY